MEKNQFREIFEKTYFPDSWKLILNELFPQRDFYKVALEEKDLPEAKFNEVNNISRFGEFNLQDTARIVFYEVELKEGKNIARNRVELRNLLHQEVIPGDVDAIIVVYFSKAISEWRVSLISKSRYWDTEMNEIKAETHPKRYTYVFGPNQTVETAIEQFFWLQNNLIHNENLDFIVRAFSVEKISKEFFDQYFKHFKIFEQYVVDSEYFAHFKQLSSGSSDNERKEDAERLVRNFIKKLLGRIVFLYFLQKKGWLGVPKDKDYGNGEKDFISELYNGYPHQLDFYEKVLVQLFFKTLNQQRTDDLFTLPGITIDGITETKVPFLNGGLFDKDPFEPVKIRFKKEMWDALFSFFGQYNFTIDENIPDDQDIGIDPEMLGLIFENLLEDNRNKGTYYTPKEVVHFMCKESLCLFISQKLEGKATDTELKQITDFIKFNNIGIPAAAEKYAGEIEKHLSNIKICDPAIGSGAFPMGMVFEILRVKKELRPFSVKSRSFSFNYRDEKLNIIKNSIYGVDIDSGAVDIARLRFWLSLIVDEEDPGPLPNLDYKIMQGDSLKEFFEDIPLDNLLSEKVTVYSAHQQLSLADVFSGPQKEIEFTTDEKVQLKELVDQYFDKTDFKVKTSIHREIDSRIIQHIEKNIELVKLQLERQIGELKANLKLSNERLKLKDALKYYRGSRKFKTYLKQKEKLVKAEKELSRKRERLLDLEQNPEKPYFLWNVFFGDVISARKGFDIVIGNPPYGVKVEDEVRDLYKVGSKDSYGVFMALAFQKLLKPDGILCYIVSDTWLTITSHYKLREQVLNKTLRKIIRLHQDCFKATVNSCIFTLINTPFLKEHSKEVIAADLTNISTRKQVPEFREKIFNLELHIGESTPIYAVYTYSQDLLFINSNKPVIFGSPKLFQLMNDTTCNKTLKRIGEGDNSKEVEVRSIEFNGKRIELIRFGDIADVKQGLATGDNEYYLYQNSEARGNYKDINEYKGFLLTESDLEKIQNNVKLRLEVIEKGIHKTKDEADFKIERYFNGRYIIPFDKGGESDTDEGWLPNYFVPTHFYIDWSCEAIERLKEYKIAERIRNRNENKKILPHYEEIPAAVIRNKDTYFTKGITFSPTGIYSPTFRIGTASVYGNKGSTIFPRLEKLDIREILGKLTSKLLRFQIKNFISHTVEAGEIVIFSSAYIIGSYQELVNLVNNVIENQRQNAFYNYFENEQKEIDKLVYQLYGLNKEDINEVETWFARRYPKLAKYADIKEPVKAIAESRETEEEKWLSIINQGENKKVEFKSTLRFCLNQKSPQAYVEHSAIKNIAAFLNTEGGTLLIGVEDNGNIIGLDNDFNTFKGTNKKDEFLKHFDNLTQKYFGNHLPNHFDIEFPVVKGKTIGAIHVKEQATEPVILKNPEKNNKEEFYVRRHASAVTLTMFEFLNYAKEHWKLN